MRRKRLVSWLLAVSTALSMISPAFALQEPDLPTKGGSVFVDDVRVEQGDPATAVMKLKYDFKELRTGQFVISIPAGTTGISNTDPMEVTNNDNVNLMGQKKLYSTGSGNLGFSNPKTVLTETSINIKVPNVSATTPIGIEVTKMSGRDDSDASSPTTIDPANIAKVVGSFIVQYPVTVQIAGDSAKPAGADIKVKTTTYDGKATYDKAGTAGTDGTDVYNSGNGGSFYVDSGAGQQNAPVLDFTVPKDYYAEVKVGSQTYTVAATTSLALPEVTANTNVTVKLVAGSIPDDTFSVTNVTYQYGAYQLGSEKVKFSKKGSEKTVAPKDFSTAGFVVSAYKLNDGAETPITGTAKVTVDLNNDTNKVEFIYKRADNSTVLPGVDGNIPSGDDVTVTPTDKSTTLPPNPTDGSVTFPEGENGGGMVADKDGSMVVPGGTRVDKEGNIYLPGEATPIKPSQPGNVPNTYYTVTYKSTEGTGTQPDGTVMVQLIKVGKGDKVRALPDTFVPVTNRKFTGWNTMNSGNGKAYAVDDQITTTLELWAQWKNKDVNYGENKITITFHSNTVAKETATQEIGDPVDATFVAPLNPSKTFTMEGWTLAGWNTKADGSGTLYGVNAKITRTKAEGNLDLHAQWTKTGKDGSITVPGKDGLPGTPDDATAKGDGTGNNPKRDETTGVITIPAGGSVTVEGKEYPLPDGGTLKPNGEITIKQPENNGGGTVVIKPDGNTEVTKPGGGTDENRTAFIVTYQSGVDGIPAKVFTVIGTTKVVSGETLFSRDGYKFAYWSKTDDANTIIAVKSDLDRAISLTANWYQVGDKGEIIVKPDPGKDDQTTVKPGPDGQTPDVDDNGNIKVPEGGTVVTKPGGSEITPPGGSVVDPDGNIKVPDKGNGGSTTIKPDDKENWPDGWFTVKYLANAVGAQGTMGEQLLKDEGDVMSCAYTLEGKTFVAWNTKNDGNGTAYAVPSKITKPADGKTVPLYAIWSIDNTKDPNGSGSITVPGKNGVLGDDDDVTINPNDKGQKPAWKDDKSGVKVPDGGTVALPGGTVITPPNGSWVKPDGTVVLPDNGGTIDPANPDQSITDNENYVKITYLPGQFGTGTMSVQLAKKGEAVTLLKAKFKATGKVFSGWNEDANGHSTPYGDEATIEAGKLTADLELFAQWVDESAANTAKVIFHANNGTDEQKEQTIGSAGTTIRGNLEKNTFTHTEKGWTLKGWTTKADGTGDFYGDGVLITLTKDATQNLFAQWVKVGDDGSITVPGKDNKPGGGDDITVKPDPEKPDKQPDVDDKGNIKIPDGGSVVTPDGEITVPGGGTLKQPEGTIEVTKPDGSGSTTIDPSKPDQVPEGMFVVTYQSGAANQNPIKVYVFKDKIELVRAKPLCL